ncbi:MAG: type II toxin-antitoxin system HicA family toxin [Lachnospiraceae bacterium]|nr:type II toxin-antitoxin system HicA family toxin [Lachnospiraceae bacterium]
MNSKNVKTYKKIYKDPINADIEWKDIESLFIALGAEISEGNGSRVRVLLNGQRAVFHRPHPESVTDKGAVKSVRKFLENAEVSI